MRFFVLTSEGNGFEKATGRNEAQRDELFFRSQSIKAIKDAGVAVIDGECTGHTPISEIELGKKRTFVAGDPLKFEGTPQEVVELKGDSFLRIEISPKVTLYCFVEDGECLYLEPL